MASTVNIAFDVFLRDYVRLDKGQSDIAKASKNNLISEIEKFPDDGEFLLLHPDVSMDYGSFSRKTKIRPLDDIDLMIILHAQGSWLSMTNGQFDICVKDEAKKLLKLCNDRTNILNSIKVVNKFKEYLGGVSSYEKADIKRNQEAATLKLKSYPWIYDIVPCFITNPAMNGSTYFLIPDGKGQWQRTDPRIDKKRTIDINGSQTVSVLDMIRLMKYWTERPTMGSYLLENLILNYYNSGVTSSQFVDVEIQHLFAYIYHNVLNDLNDPKGFQGNINHLNHEERISVQEKAR